MTQRWQKLIRSLHLKKYRQEEKLFIVEGEKSLLELLQTDWHIEGIFYSEAFFKKHHAALQKHKTVVQEVCKVSQIEQVSTLQTNEAGIAVVRMPDWRPPETITSPLTLVLDELKDPGNLGTIVRIADWYGIRHVVCSEQTTDFFSPKVITATMGSFTRVEVFYLDIVDFLKKLDRKNLSVWGSFTDGTSIYQAAPVKNVLLVIGSESHGIRQEVAQWLDMKIAIPRYGKAESLNAAVACGIMCDRLATAFR